MEKKMPEPVPYIVHEGAMARSERIIKRLLIFLAVSVVLLFASNMAWLYFWNSYDTISYDQDGSGLNNICTGLQGDVFNGATSKDQSQEEPQKGQGDKSTQE